MIRFRRQVRLLLPVSLWSAATAAGTVVWDEHYCDQQWPRAVRRGDVRAVACLEHIAGLHAWRVLSLVRANAELSVSALVLRLDDADSERYRLACVHETKGDG